MGLWARVAEKSADKSSAKCGEQLVELKNWIQVFLDDGVYHVIMGLDSLSHQEDAEYTYLVSSDCKSVCHDAYRLIVLSISARLEFIDLTSVEYIRKQLKSFDDPSHSQCTILPAKWNSVSDYGGPRLLVADSSDLLDARSRILTDNEKSILKARYVDHKTIREAAKMAGVTAARVRQIQDRALATLLTIRNRAIQ